GRDRVAAEGRGVVAGLERPGRLVGDEQAPDREAVCEPLCERDELRSHAELLEAEERARPADAGLDLVEAEERAVGCGELGGGLNELRLRGIDPALALDGLEQDHPGVLTDGRLERADVVEARERDTGDERLERLPLRRLARRRERAERPPVER